MYLYFTSVRTPDDFHPLVVVLAGGDFPFVPVLPNLTLLTSTVKKAYPRLLVSYKASPDCDLKHPQHGQNSPVQCLLRLAVPVLLPVRTVPLDTEVFL